MHITTCGWLKGGGWYTRDYVRVCIVGMKVCVYLKAQIILLPDNNYLNVFIKYKSNMFWKNYLSERLKSKIIITT